MKTYLYITLLLLLAGSACKPKPVQRSKPTILEGKSIDVSSIYGRQGNDLVEGMYRELVSKSPELEELEKQIAGLEKKRTDSLLDFTKFHEKNTSYYKLAEAKANSITDSVLRKSILDMIRQSQSKYTDSITGLVALDSTLLRRKATLTDLHLVLKLVKTVPFIEEYQKANRPSDEPVRSVLQEYDSTLFKVDTTIKQ